MDSNDKFKVGKIAGIDISKITKNTSVVPSSLQFIQKEAEENHRMMMESINRARAKKDEYDQEILTTLKGIEKNTANLTEIIRLIQNNNEKQDEIFSLLIEILSISKLNSTEQIKSAWRKVIDKINETISDVDTITRLISFGTAIYTLALQHADKIQALTEKTLEIL